MKIAHIEPLPDFSLKVTSTDGKTGCFDVRPYLRQDAFRALNDIGAFARIKNGGYYVEWECGADLSADTIEARLT